MQATKTLTAHACTVHNRVFVASLNAWMSLNDPQASMVFQKATFREAACDHCMLTAQCLLQWQFSALECSSVSSTQTRG